MFSQNKLTYALISDDIVHFEFHPVFEKSRALVGGALVLPRASLLWLGDEDSRPVYHGQATRPTITPKMDAQLWDFVQKKKMDQKMFRALVSLETTVKKLYRALNQGYFLNISMTNEM